MEIKKIMVGPVRTNCYVVADAGQALVIDPGGDAGQIIAALAGSELCAIVLTHYHFDHHLACLELKEKYPDALIMIHEADSAYLPFRADRLLAAGDKIRAGGYELEVMHTPGHSAGGICLVGAHEIFTGDTLFAGGLVGRTDLPGASPADLEASLRRLEKILPDLDQAYPGHGRNLELGARSGEARP